MFSSLSKPDSQTPLETAWFAPDYQRLLDRADRALYQAKEGGRNRCVLAD